MTGTIINVAAIILGSLIGILFGARLPEKLKSTIVAGMGVFVAALGIQMFLKTENSLIVLGAVLIGTLLGEWWRVEDGLHKLGEFLEIHFSREKEYGSNKFLRGFITASLLFCIRPRGDSGVDPGRPDRQLQPAGCQIRPRRLCLDRMKKQKGFPHVLDESTLGKM